MEPFVKPPFIVTFRNSDAGFGYRATETSSLSTTLPLDCANNPTDKKRNDIITKSFIAKNDLSKYIK